jgi:putrescine aminotransferase
VLLISDEVICGFGRLGTWFGCETMGTQPDFMTMAKGITSGYLPLGGAMVSDRVVEVLYRDGDFNHGYTYSGHPVACAVAIANIKLMQSTGIVDTVKNDTAPYLKEKFEALNDHPLVVDAKTCGMVAGLVLIKDKANNTPFEDDDNVGMICRGHCFSGGLVMRAVGDRMIIAPPLTISHAEIDELVQKARAALDATLADLKAKKVL